MRCLPIHAIRCREKRERGNLYLSKRAAKLDAQRASRAAGHRIGFFRCPACQCWHIGKPRLSDRRRAGLVATATPGATFGVDDCPSS